VPQWEYRKLALSPLPRKTDEIDLLCDAGEDGWILVTILPNNIAYLKRSLDDDANADADHSTERRVQDVKVKYRNPATADTWSG
jgi:hypothetical protein